MISVLVGRPSPIAIDDSPRTSVMTSDSIFEQERLETPPNLEFDASRAIAVVVGAHPRAEITDRPWANLLVRRMRTILADRGFSMESGGPIPLVVTDVWFLNDDVLRRQPTVAIGDPAVNAASAFFANRLPCAYAIENACQLLLDPELLEPRACLWGIDDESLKLAMTRFETKWIEPFLDASEHVIED